METRHSAQRERGAGRTQRRGTTHLAIALGYKATQAGIKTRFITAADLLLTEEARKTESLKEVMQRAIKAYQLLMFDEIGFLPMNCGQANLFFRVIAALYEKSSLIVMNNLTLGQWGFTSAGDTTLTAEAGMAQMARAE